MRKYIALLITLVFPCKFIAQESLMDILNQETSQNNDTIYAIATFKGTRVVSGQSIETAGKNELNVGIQHRFDIVKGGLSEFYGLDQSATIRLGIDYGVTNRFEVGIGRSNQEKLVDGHIKYKIIRQCQGALNIPVTITWFSSVAAITQKWTYPERDNRFASRFFYAHELLIARKFTERLSLQVIPGIIHRNLVKTKEDQNIVPYTGIAGRVKLTKRLSFNSEYYYVWPGKTADDFVDALSLGFDIETGGHIFQLHISNSKGMVEKNMITENSNKWQDMEFRIGFNIIRNFNLSKK